MAAVYNTNGRWLPTPFVTISMGIGANAKSELIFTTLTHLNPKKYISDVIITQTSNTTVKYTATLIYYPGTFSSGTNRYGVPDVLESKLKLAIESKNTEKIYIQFGYYSNSPYTSEAETSPTYVGLITNIDSQVEQNYIKYQIEAYGVDIALGYFVTTDSGIDKSFDKDTNVKEFLVKILLNEGNIVVDSMNFNFDIVIEDINLDRTFWEILSEGVEDVHSAAYGAMIQRESDSIINSLTGRPTGNIADNTNQQINQRLQQLTNNIQDYFWNKIKKSLSFKNLTSNLIDKSNGTNLSTSNAEDTMDRNQFSAYEAVEILNRLLNYNILGKKYNLRCVIEPWYSNGGSYDGTIRIFNAVPNTLSKREFFWGSWSNSAGYLSNQNNVISWSCDYNSTALLFSNNKFKTTIYGNINTDLELSLDEDGNVHYSLTSSQTEGTTNSDYKASIDYNTQYDMILSALNTVLDYPYKAEITVLGITDVFHIAKDTIKVNVFVNGAKHFTSGIYMITGYSHHISDASFTTTYQLIKIPEKSTLSDIESISKDILGKSSATNPTTDSATAYYTRLKS